MGLLSGCAGKTQTDDLVITITAHSYMTLEGSTACWKTMEGACYHQLQL